MTSPSVRPAKDRTVGWTAAKQGHSSRTHHALASAWTKRNDRSLRGAYQRRRFDLALARRRASSFATALLLFGSLWRLIYAMTRMPRIAILTAALFVSSMIYIRVKIRCRRPRSICCSPASSASCLEHARGAGHRGRPGPAGDSVGARRLLDARRQHVRDGDPRPALLGAISRAASVAVDQDARSRAACSSVTAIVLLFLSSGVQRDADMQHFARQSRPNRLRPGERAPARSVGDHRRRV